MIQTVTFDGCVVFLVLYPGVCLSGAMTTTFVESKVVVNSWCGNAVKYASSFGANLKLRPDFLPHREMVRIQNQD